MRQIGYFIFISKHYSKNCNTGANREIFYLDIRNPLTSFEKWDLLKTRRPFLLVMTFIGIVAIILYITHWVEETDHAELPLGMFSGGMLYRRWIYVLVVNKTIRR